MRKAAGAGLAFAIAPLVVLALVLPDAAQGAGFAAGLDHPLHGLDHLLAMVAVGVWAAQSDGRAAWAFPTAFVAAMVMGGVLGAAGFPLPAVEAGIAASVILLGGAVAANLKFALGLSTATIAMFGLFHGHAHGAEMPEAVSPTLYALGFLLATATLNAAGLAGGRVAIKALRRRGEELIRLAGGGIAATGAMLAVL